MAETRSKESTKSEIPIQLSNPYRPGRVEPFNFAPGQGREGRSTLSLQPRAAQQVNVPTLLSPRKVSSPLSEPFSLRLSQSELSSTLRLETRTNSAPKTSKFHFYSGKRSASHDLTPLLPRRERPQAESPPLSPRDSLPKVALPITLGTRPPTEPVVTPNTTPREPASPNRLRHRPRQVTYSTLSEES